MVVIEVCMRKLIGQLLDQESVIPAKSVYINREVKRLPAQIYRLKKAEKKN
jgi:hypothetical protein